GSRWQGDQDDFSSSDHNGEPAHEIPLSRPARRNNHFLSFKRGGRPLRLASRRALPSRARRASRRAPCRSCRRWPASLTALPCWVDKNLSSTVFEAKQNRDFWKRVFETGKTPSALPAPPHP